MWKIGFLMPAVSFILFIAGGSIVLADTQTTGTVSTSSPSTMPPDYPPQSNPSANNFTPNAISSATPSSPAPSPSSSSERTTYHSGWNWFMNNSGWPSAVSNTESKKK